MFQEQRIGSWPIRNGGGSNCEDCGVFGLLTRGLKIARFAAGDLLWKVANVVVLAVAARVLPQEQAGLVVLSQTASMILLSLGDLGFRASGIRLISLAQNNAREVVRVVMVRRALSVLIAGLPGALVCSALLVDDISAFFSLALLLIAYLPYFFSMDWGLLALGQTGQVAIARGAYGLVLIAFAALALVFDVNLTYFAFMVLSGYGVFAFICWYFLKKHTAYSVSIDGKHEGVTKLNVGAELAWTASIALASSFAINTIFHSLEILLAGAFLGENESALFAAPFRLVFSIYAVGWILTQYFSPHFARLLNGELKSKLRFFVVFFFYGTIASVATFLLAPWLTTIVYGDAFPNAAVVMQWLAPTILLDSLVACQGTLLVMHNRGLASAFSLGAGCLASLVVFLMFREQGIVAVVAAKYAAYIALFSMQTGYILWPQVRVSV